VQIPPAFSDCVAFLCGQRRGKPGGTAFVVEFEERDSYRAWTYLVTALHCIEEVAGEDIYVRVNTNPDARPGIGSEDIKTRKDDWFRHPNADVALIPSPIAPTRYSFQQVPADLFIDRRYHFDVQRLAGRGNPFVEPMLRDNFPDGIAVEVGHAIFSPGLFVQSAGTDRNLPVVRFGNIARMPGDEKIVLSSKQRGDVSIRAYLVETHSWGGFSGSPIFWHYQFNVARPINAVTLRRPERHSPLVLPQRPKQPERVNVMTGIGWAAALLGVVSGHYDIPTKAKHEEIETALNAGIAVVTPAENVRELLMSEEVVEDRKRRAAQDKAPAATADSAMRGKGHKQRTPKGLEIPIPKRADFLSDLDKATRKRK
jgi:hypothetical protein